MHPIVPRYFVFVNLVLAIGDSVPFSGKLFLEAKPISILLLAYIYDVPGVCLDGTTYRSKESRFPHGT